MANKKRRLPLLTERSVSEVNTLKSDLFGRFELQTRAEVSKNSKAITCTAGCASCCYHPIEISVLEGILIYRHLVGSGKWNQTLKKKLQKIAEEQYDVPYAVWLLSLKACPFLGPDNLCGVYSARPLICRSYYATSDPYYCHPHRLGPNTELINRDEIVLKFHQEEQKILKKHGVSMMTIPIGAAVLLGERVCVGDIDLESIDHILFKEYAQKG